MYNTFESLIILRIYRLKSANRKFWNHFLPATWSHSACPFRTCHPAAAASTEHPDHSPAPSVAAEGVAHDRPTWSLRHAASDFVVVVAPAPNVAWSPLPHHCPCASAAVGALWHHRFGPVTSSPPLECGRHLAGGRQPCLSPNDADIPWLHWVVVVVVVGCCYPGFCCSRRFGPKLQLCSNLDQPDRAGRLQWQKWTTTSLGFVGWC